MTWNWQVSLADKYSRNSIFVDMMSDSSLLFDLAKEDVAKILQKTNYRFIVQNMHYDDIYPLSIDITKNQIKKFLKKKKGFLSCNALCDESNLKIIKKVVQRIANNICNLFDDRYKTCITKDLIYLKNSLYTEVLDETNDPLEMLLLEEMQKEISGKREYEQKKYRKYLIAHTSIETSGQLVMKF